MSSRRRGPGESLHRLVEGYWVADRDLSADGGFLVTPDRYIDLLFSDDPIHAEGGGRSGTLPRCALLGLLDGPLRLTSAGVVRCAGVRMQGWVKGLFFTQEQAGPWCDASVVVGGDAPAIFTAMREERIEDLFDRLEALIEALIAPSLASLREYADVLAGRGRSPSLPEICRRWGKSVRQTERRVKAMTHVSPKRLESLARFQFVRDRLWAEPGGSLVRIAAEAGYADQAHMQRDFKRYAGITPRTFVRRMREMRSGNA